MYISKIKTRFRSDSDAAVLGSLGFATTLWQLSQLTKCRRLHTVLILLIYTAGLFFTGQLLRPAFGKIDGLKNPTVPPLCRKTPGSLEAGGYIAYFQTVRRRRHLVRVESRLMAANPRKLSTAASSPERKRV